ncbi:recombinase family protein [Cognatiyoonia sp. IB215182]|uniref:recombinase family protein n=1 Tax=Cognatiyoonia sp. IB215182 TaxID=3097353 RepID=UPI002A0BA9F2|nr:recombinase family protein [Cognatiyoonia sp. IB215182]MDX8353966.1 recombinase family protein [Cognatiyoonia sp. IB215182]
MSQKKALIYCRVSDIKQANVGDGLKSQETRCREHAEANGYDVVMVFPDIITGGGDFLKRTGMVSLLAFMDEHPDEEFVIIFDDLKRFARDRDFHFKLREAFRDRRATLECLNYRFDDSPEGEFVETIFAAQGQLERKQNARQTRQKTEARMKNGYWVHSAPLGYAYKAVKGRGKMLFPDEPVASIVKEAFEGYASGRFGSQAEVTRFCASFPEFPRNGKGKVVQELISKMLTRPIYTGHICSDHYDIHWLKGQHDALISMETFEKVQSRRAGATYAPKRANIGDDFALRGAVACGCCGVALRSSWTKGSTKRYPYYLCQTKGCEAYGKSIPRDKLENEVGEIIKSLQPSKSLLAMAESMFRYIWEARRSQAKDAVASGKQEIHRLEKEISGVLDRIMSASNDTIIRRYEDKVEMLERQKAIMVEKLGKQIEPKGAFDEKLELACKFLSNPWKIWENGTTSARRLVLKLAFTTPIQYYRNEGARTPDLSLPFKALGGTSGCQFCYGARGRNRTTDTRIFN